MGVGLFTSSIFTFSAVVFSIFLIYVIVKYIKKSVVCYKQINEKSLKYSFVAVLAFYIILYILFFPGFLGSDDLNMTRTVMNGRAWEWQSLSYSFLSAAGIMMFGQFGFLPLLAIAYYSYLSLKMLTLLDALKVKLIYKKIVALVFVLLSLHPYMQGMLLTYARDVVYSLMLIHLSLMLYGKNNWSTKDLAWLAGFLVFFADLRQESFIYLVAVPAVLGFSKVLNFKQLKIYSLFTTIAVVLYFYIAPKVYETHSYNSNYQVTAYVHPLSHVLNKNGREFYNKQDLEAIDRVFSVQKLIENYTPLDIGPFHSGGYNQNVNEEQWADFKVAAKNVMLQSKFDIFKSRVILFMCTLNVCYENGGVPFFDIFRDSPEQVEPTLQLMSKTAESYTSSENLQKYFNLIQDFYTWTGFWRVLNTLVLPMLFILWGILLFNRFPQYFRASVVVAARLPAIFLLAPANYYKYVFSIQLFFTIFFPLVLLTYIASNQKNIELKIEAS